MAWIKKTTEFDETNPQLSIREGLQAGWYVARMAKRGLAGEGVYQGDLEKKVDRVIDKARRRIEKNAEEAAKAERDAKKQQGKRK
ncbi:DUF6257 family protein [Streptomyces sp. NPDC020807]|uniref:DUF6257 family protein n=1 Tax=Streptomyces sp. NPDC020807 TaxID=3155119 RepID=UPI0033C23FD5